MLSRKWIFLVIIVILSIFQVTILDYFKIFDARADLFLVSIMVVSLNFGLKWALSLSIFAGILKDALSINTFGINTLLFPLWSFLIIKLSKKISLDNNFIVLAVLCIIVILNDIITRLIFSFFGHFVPMGIFLRITFLESLYTTLVLFLVLRIKCIQRSLIV